MKNKIIFLDAISVQKKGINYFLNSPEWPVKEKLFWKLTNFIFSEYFKELQSLNSKFYKLALIEVQFAGLLIDIMHYNYVKNFAVKNKYEYIFDKSADKFLNPNWDEISDVYEKYSYPYNKIMRLMRKIVKIIYFNRHLSIFSLVKGIFSKKVNISFGSFDKIKEDYIKNSNKFFLHIEWIDLINKCDFNKKKKNKISINIISNILKKVSDNASLSLFLKGLNLKKIIAVSNKRLQSINTIYDFLLTLNTPKEIIITESPNVFHKIISSAYLSKGSNIINFSHGNDIGLIHQKWTQTYFYAQSGNYGFENNKICSVIKRSVHKLALKKTERTNFFSVNSDIGLKRENIIFTRIKKKKIKKVMLMGYPMNSTRYTDEVYCFYYYSLKLQIKILQYLKGLGFYTIYKSHPDRLLEIGNLMNDFTDEYEDSKFENIWEKADAIIFTYPTTTTFGFAITTPLPILLISEKSTDWNHTEKFRIMKRIQILDYEYNFGKYKGINPKNLILGLEEAKNKKPYQLI